jgi:hypothetical protein
MGHQHVALDVKAQ